MSDENTQESTGSSGGPPQKVKDIMDHYPTSVSPKDSVETVISDLQKNDARSLPVVDGDDRVVGIVTESDLVMEDEREKIHLPPYLNIMGGIVFLEPLKGFERKVRKAFASNVEDMMTSKVVTANEDTSLHEAGRLLASGAHRQLPVVDDDGKLVGLVERIDVLAALADE